MVGNRTKVNKSLSVSFLLCLFVCSWTLVLTSCSNDTKHPDVDHITIDLRTARLDRDLAALDTNNLTQGLSKLNEEYPLFLNFYLDTLMGFGVHGNYSMSAEAMQKGLQPFLSHPDIRGLFDTVQHHFPDTKAIDEQLVMGFKYLRHYYPEQPVPKVVYFISGLNQWSAITYDTLVVGVGLDMYLGPQYPFYAAVQIPEYVVRKCSPEYIPVNVFQAIYRDKHPFEMEERTLLDMMIQRGKEQYFLERIVPFTEEHERFVFTKEQLEWCEQNEAEIYNFFVSQNLLYEKNWQKIVRYVNDGPSATGMPLESPGNIGTWLGYRILMEYSDKHSDLSMQELFQVRDAQKLLQDAKYKPR